MPFPLPLLPPHPPVRPSLPSFKFMSLMVFLLPRPQRQRQLQPIVSGCKVEDFRLQIRELEWPHSHASVGWKNMSYDTAHAPVSGLNSCAAIQEICPGFSTLCL